MVVMMPFDESLHPRGQAANRGWFAALQHDPPANHLTPVLPEAERLAGLEADAIYYDDVTSIAEAIVGHAIVGAERVQGGSGEVSILTLDDATELHVFANEGCPECPAGEFGIDAIAAFPNVITRVEVVDDRADRFGDDAMARLELNVYAQGASATVVEASGSEGNGYYGRGFTIVVVHPGHSRHRGG
ncbi:hypothetical protein [Microbacterium hominis]|uniref:DUF7448 domain-containing protein n=1 Tax=Microbacterium hominis TaxID=162426 RepID=UPI0018E37379|nr:hypothetical protein [Microbacterium hominis]